MNVSGPMWQKIAIDEGTQRRSDIQPGGACLEKLIGIGHWLLTATVFVPLQITGIILIVL